jgi:hypothetical protein
VVENTMNSDDYINIIANNLILWVRGHPDIIFQQDGAPCHTSSYSTWWFLTHNVSILDWVAQSPDLNPIENLWGIIDNQIRKKNLRQNLKKN